MLNVTFSPDTHVDWISMSKADQFKTERVVVRTKKVFCMSHTHSFSLSQTLMTLNCAMMIRKNNFKLSRRSNSQNIF